MTDTAAFDFDGTLLPRDSLVPFLASVAGRRAVAVALVRRGPRIAAALGGLADRAEAKCRLLTDLLAGRSVSEVEAAAGEFARRLLDNLRPDVLARLRWHQAAAHQTVIVSASPAIYLRRLGRALGIDEVLATELEVRDGVLTGRLAGPNCRGAEKVARLRSWLGDGEHGRLWVYGDSAGDSALFAIADVAQRVRKRPIPARPEVGVA